MSRKSVASKRPTAKVPATTPAPPTDTFEPLTRFVDNVTLELRECASLLALIREREEALASRDSDLEGGLANIERQITRIAKSFDDIAYRNPAAQAGVRSAGGGGA